MEPEETIITPEHLADALAAVSADATARGTDTSANLETAKVWNTTAGMVGLARAFVGLGRHQTVTIAALGLSEGNQALLALGRKFGERNHVR